ncbi:MAG: XkdF-like putative serine protease domain-containing protein [Methylocella sp.]
MTKEWATPIEIAKLNEEKKLIFGWASVVEKDGKDIIDLQDDRIDIGDLEDAVYAYVVDSRSAGEMHARVEGVGKLVESIVMTREKQHAMGFPEGATPLGWWVGYRLEPDVFAKVKSGEYRMLSIGGSAVREPE